MQRLGIKLMAIGVIIGLTEIALHVFADYEELPLYLFAGAFAVVGATLYGYGGRKKQREGHE